MSSQKLLSNRSVLHLLKSSFNGRGQICQICGLANCLRENPLASVLHHQQAATNGMRLTSTSTKAASASIVSPLASSSPTTIGMTRRGFGTSNNTSNTSVSTKASLTSKQSVTKTLINNNNTNNYLNKHQQLRHSSTTSATNQLATEILVKRDASTQARQQIKEKPNYLQQESFRCSELDIVKCSPQEMSPKPPVDSLLFGKVFTDHMFRVDWDEENGWTTPLISKVHDLPLHPAAKVFHYGLGAFEGAKAYRGHDNKIRFFRLDQNIKRLLQSSRRLSLPEFDIDEMIKCVHKLVELEQDWIPVSQGRKQLTSLYIRPLIMGVEPSLGVASSKKAILSVLLSPVGPYFKTGFKPVSLYADPDVVRAWPGGAGSSKLGSNYAPTIYPQRQAEELGHQQVLWLFGDDEKLTEVGTMNIFVSYRDEDGQTRLVTPPLHDGLILPGITRQSIIELAAQWPDIICEERYLTISDIQQLVENRQLLEMFGSGTACIVCPISSINLKDGRKIVVPTYNLNDPSQSYALTHRILSSITDIQYGKIPHPWAQELGNC